VRTFALHRTAMMYREYPVEVIEDGEPATVAGVQVLFLPIGEQPTLLDEGSWVAGEYAAGVVTVLYAGSDVPTDAPGYDDAVVVPLEGHGAWARVVDAPERLPTHLEDVRVF
jgi:hypothetical protein